MMDVFILEDSFSRITLFNEVLGGSNVCVRSTVESAKAAYEEYKPFDLILLDHDLEDDHYTNQGEQVGTGTEFARWLKDFNPDCPVVIHSYNLDGAKRMEADLKRAGWDVRLQPFGMGLLRALEVLK